MIFFIFLNQLRLEHGTAIILGVSGRVFLDEISLNLQIGIKQVVFPSVGEPHLVLWRPGIEQSKSKENSVSDSF